MTTSRKRAPAARKRSAPKGKKQNSFLVNIELDATTAFQRSPTVEHECKAAIHDLLEGNHFAPRQRPGVERRSRPVPKTECVHLHSRPAPGAKSGASARPVPKTKIYNGPYRLRLGIEDNRLLFDIATASGEPHGRLLLSLTPFRKLLKDYFLVCQSYWRATREGATAHIEAIDMGRRGLHDDGSRLLQERLAGKIDVDWETARRLFTLICALHISE